MKVYRLSALLALLTAGCAENTCPIARDMGLECSGNLWHVEGIPNLGRVRANVYRGGQLCSDGESEAACLAEWQALARRGVRRVLKLNTEEEGSDALAERVGIRVYRVSIPPSTKRWLSVFTEPDRESIEALRFFAAAMADPSTGAWYIHCQNGHDRTGLVVMLVRVLVDGWDPLQAYEEARQWGYHHQIPGLDEARRQYVKP
jgi:hypothetical protein